MAEHSGADVRAIKLALSRQEPIIRNQIDPQDMETSLAQSLKLALVHATGLSKDALHIYVGLTVFFALAATSRSKLSSLLPLLIVFAVAILGELVDMRDDLASLGYWRWRANVHDILNTVFWPTVLTVLVRRTGLFQNPRNL